jgi:hypothetical protein
MSLGRGVWAFVGAVCGLFLGATAGALINPGPEIAVGAIVGVIVGIAIGVGIGIATSDLDRAAASRR